MTTAGTFTEPHGAAAPTTSDASRPEDPLGPTRRREAKVAATVFVAFVVVGAAALLFSLARYFWFHGDEWNYLVSRDGGNFGDLIHPRNEHLSFIPIATYRVLWHLVGLRSYLPYQIPVIAVHLTTASLLRVLMRRCGVNPWIATAAAAIFVLFGPGEETIVWGAQLGQGGTIAFGLSQLVIADHEGSIDRRDWIALVFGFLAFLCSGFSPFFVVLVGVVIFIHRGRRPALLQAVPVGLSYIVWYVVIGQDRITDPYGRPTNWIAILRFIRDGFVATFEGMASGSAALAVLYGLVIIVGLALAWSRLPSSQRLRRMALPISMLAMALGFLFVSGYGRWWLAPGTGSSSRYVYTVAALSLPALAVGVDAIARLWRPGAWIAAVVLASTIPYGIGQFDTNPPWSRAYFSGRRELIAALARSPYISEVPRSTRPDVAASDVTAGWLLDALHAGKLPALKRPNDALTPDFRLRFGLAVVHAPVPPGTRCSVIRKPIDLELHKGQLLGVEVGPWTTPKPGWYFELSYTMQLLQLGRPIGSSILVYPGLDHQLRTQLDNLDVRFAPAPGAESFILCR